MPELTSKDNGAGFGGTNSRLSARLAALRTMTLILSLGAVALPLPGREKDTTAYGTGLIVNVPFPEAEVTPVVEDVAQNGIIRGTKEYNKDEYVSGATPAKTISSRVFKEWTEGGKVFYKVRLKALDPRNFKDSNDMGTLAVRYVVQPQGPKNTVLRIDAVFVEDFRHISHPSNGSVEGAEYKDIHDRLDAIESMKAETTEAEQENARERQLRSLGEQQGGESTSSATKETTPIPAPSTPAVQKGPASSFVPQAVVETSANPDAPSGGIGPPAPPQTLEERVKSLRLQVERRVRAPGAPLKSAPFHTANTLQSLPTGTQVLIVISTPYWLGVETHSGEHGWILRDELEQVP